MSMYPKHGRQKDFFEGRTNSGFSRGGPKIFLQGGQKWQNYTLETKQTTFFAKHLMETCQISKSCGALATPFDAHAPETSYNKTAEVDNKTYLPVSV